MRGRWLAVLGIAGAVLLGACAGGGGPPPKPDGDSSGSGDPEIQQWPFDPLPVGLRHRVVIEFSASGDRYTDQGAILFALEEALSESKRFHVVEAGQEYDYALDVSVFTRVDESGVLDIFSQKQATATMRARLVEGTTGVKRWGGEIEAESSEATPLPGLEIPRGDGVHEKLEQSAKAAIRKLIIKLADETPRKGRGVGTTGFEPAPVEPPRR
jgi:hypothetical protein